MELYPPDHPIYQPCHPPVSNFGLLEAVRTAMAEGYRRGFAEGSALVLPPVRQKARVTVRTASDRSQIIARIQAMAEAVERELEGRGKVLVDFQKMARTLYQEILNDLRDGNDHPADPPAPPQAP